MFNSRKQKMNFYFFNPNKNKGGRMSLKKIMNAGFKTILNFKHKIEREKIDNQKSSSKLSATLLALILGASVFMAGQVWAAKYVTDPTTGKVVTAPEYGGTITSAVKEARMSPDIMFSRAGAVTVRGFLEKPSFVNRGIDRAEFPFVGQTAPPFALKGALAESWETPDDTTVILHIRKGVHWHDKPPMNGRELTAQDIEYNYHRLLGNKLTGTEFSEAEPSAYIEQLASVSFESITATDKWTVVFELKEPHLGALAAILDDWGVYIYPPEVIKEHGDANDWRTLVGTGPFMLTDWVDGSSLTWTKNPDYWGYDEKYPQNRLPYVDELDPSRKGFRK